MRILHAEVALLLVSAACTGCSYPRATIDEFVRSAPEGVTVPEGWTPIQLGLVGTAQLFPSTYDVHGARIDLLNGRSPIVNGLDLGPSFNLSDASHGLQGGFSNYVGTEGWGLQAGVANFVGRGRVDDGYSGLQVAGFSNSGSADGIQLAGYLNGALLKRSRDTPWIHGHLRGLQIAGVFNIARSVAGVQVAAGNAAIDGFSGLQVGGMNWAWSPERSRAVQDPPWIHGDDAPGHVRGLQVAAAANLAKRVVGVQVAAAFNLSGGGLSGLQVGGVNVAESETDIGADGRGLSSGLQLGAVNTAGIAGCCVQVGLVNTVAGGSGLQFGLWNSNPDGFLPYCPILNFSW